MHHSVVWEFHKKLIYNIYRSEKITFLNKLTGTTINAHYQYIIKNSQKYLTPFTSHILLEQNSAFLMKSIFDELSEPVQNL